MASHGLTVGFLAEIMQGNELQNPVVQILGSKRIAGSGEQSERYRLLISDGKTLYSFAMLGTQLNDLQKQGKLPEYTIIRIDRYTTSVVNRNEKGEKRVLIIVELTVLKDGGLVGEKIGNPQSLTESASQAASGGGSASGNEKPRPMDTNSTGGISNGSSYGANRSMLSSATQQKDNITLTDSLTHPISSLSPYQNKWVIKARVISKSGIRTWSNAKGEGKLFSMDLMDESGEIRLTAFKEQCDRYYPMIEVDNVYLISKCQLKPANKQYSSLKNDYEMTMTNDTIVQKCTDADGAMPEIQYNFVPISQIANLEPNALVDIIGMCKEASEMVQFTAKTSGRELRKREITLVDDSKASVQLTLWGDDAQNFPATTNPVVLVKGGRVSEFGGGKTLGLIGGSVMKLDPDNEAATRVRSWYASGGADQALNSVSARTGGGAAGMATEWISFQEAKDRNLGAGDKPDYFQIKAMIHTIKSSNAVYKACPQTDCNKKVIDQENGQFRCEKCNADFPNFKYRLLVNMLIGDWTSNRWVTVFTELAEEMLGKTSQEIGSSLEFNKEEAERIFSAVSFKSFVFKLRTKVEYFGEQPRNKTSAVSVAPVNHKEYNALMIKSIQELTGVGKN
ncbi:replication protein A 70 kDa DNA-binding subunit [Anopheles ziemanni]|uniref:replication protein A 70 kDa DNA-binding subunit n=1 Tax=Anopheles coustani TaxID=139045 RepID=UPI0026585E0D|nr:replication protein A 70 kDa DNA-binding subunit [Anopheles coustani]XP_058174504.1 replication protein A 70 kDa DNA-binding subunit [Anopheles ziemanni]